MVQINSIDSDLITILCGGPQGSILGPLLFLVYINDLRYATRKSLVHHFADDTNLILSNRSLKTLRKTMNKELDSMTGFVQIDFHLILPRRIFFYLGTT